MDYEQAMAELCLLLEGGDLLGKQLEELKTERFKEFFWKKSGMSWENVAVVLEKELQLRESEVSRGVSLLHRSPTPLLNDIHSAAPMIFFSFEDIVFMIEEYARRCSKAHSGIKELVRQGEFELLAAKLLRLRHVLESSPEIQRKHYLRIISRFESEHFEWYGWKKSGKYDSVHLILTPSAAQRRYDMSVAARRAEEEERAGLGGGLASLEYIASVIGEHPSEDDDEEDERAGDGLASHIGPFDD